MSDKNKEKAAERQIKLLVRYIKNELDKDDTLTNKKRAEILIEKMNEFQKEVKEEGVTLQKADLKPFSMQLKTYIDLHKKEKEEEEAKAKAAKDKAKKERRKTRKIAHKLAREGVEILRRRDEAAAAAASAKDDDEEEIIFGAAARGPPPGFTLADKGRYSPNGGRKRKTRKKRRKNKKRRKTKKRRKRKTRRTRKNKGGVKGAKPKQNTKTFKPITKTRKRFQKPKSILKLRGNRNSGQAFAGIRRKKVAFSGSPLRAVSSRASRAQLDAETMLNTSIQGAQKSGPLSTFTGDLNRALPYTPPPMPTIKADDSDDELKDIAAEAKN
tara:strand:- start:78 stop:1058 length:981 start_codon:yes stop_codon:yes gene_type:complete